MKFVHVASQPEGGRSLETRGSLRTQEDWTRRHGSKDNVPCAHKQARGQRSQSQSRRVVAAA